MGKLEQAQQREQRLAAKLRENLKRRKQQGRARSEGREASPEIVIPEPVPDNKP